MTIKDNVARRLTRAALACLLAAPVIAATPEPEIVELDEVLVIAREPLRLDDFVEFPKYDSVTISPGGTRLAMGWTDNDFRRQVAIIEFPSLKPLYNHTLSASLSVSDLRWANERRLLIQPQWPVRGFLRRRESLGVIMISDPNGGNPHFINGETLTSTVPLEMHRQDQEAALAAARSAGLQAGHEPDSRSIGPVRMVAARVGEPDLALFQTMLANDRRGGTSGRGAYQLDLKDNRQTRVATLPVTGGQFITGPGNRIALVSAVNDRNETVVYYLPEGARDAGADWKLVVSSPAGQRGLRPIAWTGNGEEYYALDGRSALTRGVVIWNAQNNTQRVLHRHPTADLDNFSLDPSGKPWLFWGNDHFPLYWYPDPAHPLAKLHRALDKKTPGEQIDVINSSDDLNVAVVRVSSGRRPPVYLVLDVRTGNSLTGLFTYPTLRGKRLAQVDPIEFRSRDGLEIRGYLTTPEEGNGKPRRGLPLIVIAHDGPLSEPAQYQYEFERQLFASRGYAVLQVNRRGSTGRGAAYERAGDGRWGRQVQDDYADGVRWAINDGVADPERICFYGTGYGAFSAMVTAAREPAMFKCVIGVGGIYDLPRMLGEGKQEIAPALQQVLGSDMAELQARSPTSLAGSIKAKVLLMPHEKDEYVPIEQTSRMRAALKDAGNAAQHEILGQEYDGYHSPATRAGGYVRILRFLERNIGQ